ncbi:MAG: succinate dehydrogenase/fumarate reductase iron-sulfur subunit [Anaerolineae bacterium]
MKEVKFKVFRFDPGKEAKGHYREYAVEWSKGLTVLDGLRQIKGYQDGTLTFRRSCRSAICGSCGMRINGHNRLACRTQVADIVGDSGTVLVEPLSYQKVVKDLVVDQTAYWEKYTAVRPWLIPNEANPPPEKEYLISPEQVAALNDAEVCIQCGCCYSGCTMVWSDPQYLGPAALLSAYRFVADPRDGAQEERLKIVDSIHGVWRCHTIFNCIDACPKELSPTWAIEQLRKRIVAQKAPWLPFFR